MTRRQWACWTLAAVAAIALFIQFVPVTRVNPPEVADLDAPPEVRAILRTSCYDCHSNETVWPWYSKVAPTSWLVARDVTEGRRHLNFSKWNKYNPEKVASLRARIVREVGKGDMPPWYYTVKHRDAKLTEAQRTVLTTWTAQAK